MGDLTQETCEACRAGAPTVTEDEIAELHPQIPQWEIVEYDGIRKLERTFKLENFETALSFTNSVGDLAELERHHPTVTTEWGKVTVTWFSKKIRGLHRSDFIMAAKTDKLYEIRQCEPPD